MAEITLRKKTIKKSDNKIDVEKTIEKEIGLIKELGFDIDITDNGGESSTVGKKSDQTIMSVPEGIPGKAGNDISYLENLKIWTKKRHTLLITQVDREIKANQYDVKYGITTNDVVADINHYVGKPNDLAITLIGGKSSLSSKDQNYITWLRGLAKRIDTLKVKELKKEIKDAGHKVSANDVVAEIRVYLEDFEDIELAYYYFDDGECGTFSSSKYEYLLMDAIINKDIWTIKTLKYALNKISVSLKLSDVVADMKKYEKDSRYNPYTPLNQMQRGIEGKVNDSNPYIYLLKQLVHNEKETIQYQIQGEIIKRGFDEKYDLTRWDVAADVDCLKDACVKSSPTDSYERLLISIIENENDFLKTEQDKDDYFNISLLDREKIDAWCYFKRLNIELLTYGIYSYSQYDVDYLKHYNLTVKGLYYYSFLERFAFIEINTLKNKDNIANWGFTLRNEKLEMTSEQRSILLRLYNIQYQKYKLSPEQLIKARAEFLRMHSSNSGFDLAHNTKTEYSQMTDEEFEKWVDEETKKLIVANFAIVILSQLL